MRDPASNSVQSFAEFSEFHRTPGRGARPRSLGCWIV